MEGVCDECHRVCDVADDDLDEEVSRRQHQHRRQPARLPGVTTHVLTACCVRERVWGDFFFSPPREKCTVIARHANRCADDIPFLALSLLFFPFFFSRDKVVGRCSFIRFFYLIDVIKLMIGRDVVLTPHSF